jgi:hypothetical protein
VQPRIHNLVRSISFSAPRQKIIKPLRKLRHKPQVSAVFDAGSIRIDT